MVKQTSAERLWTPRLRLWTGGILLAAFAALVTLQFFAGRYLYTDGFAEAEQRDLLARSRHAQALLAKKSMFLALATEDYAAWLETHNFIGGQNPGYPDANWPISALQRFDADMVFVVDRNGHPALRRGLDARRQRLAEPTEAEAAAVQPGGVLWPQLDATTRRDGYTSIGGRPYLWAAAPVVVHELGLPLAGWLLMMRRIDAAFIAELEADLDAKVRFRIVQIRENARATASTPLRADELHAGTMTANTVEASFVPGTSTATSRLEVFLTTPRHLNSIVSRVSGYFLWASLGFGGIIAMLAMWWMQEWLLAPLSQISQGLETIGKENDLSARLPLVGHKDEITGLALAANRMLEQIEAKTGAESARDAAIEASRLKSEFLARMSHEIRTPMNGVLGMTELLESTALDERQRHYAGTIRESAGALLGIINDVLDFSKIEAGKFELDDAPFDLREAVESTVELMAPRAQVKGVELVCDMAPDAVTAFRGDALRLRQILINLIGNAIKFTSHGEVVLRLQAVETGSHHAILKFEVLDTGIGIQPGNIDKVFESFSQEDGSTSRRFGGTGLGLAISKQLVQMMGGRIGVKSTPGLGSTFWFTVRLGTDIRAARRSDVWDLSGTRILIVDDNETNREILHRQLQMLSADVQAVTSGREAVAALQTSVQDGNPFRLAILDLDMPDMDGLQTIDAIRAIPALAAVQLVMLSSITSAAKHSDGAGFTLAAWLTKPVRQAELYECLRSVLAEPAPASAAAAAGAPIRAPAARLDRRVLLVEDNPVNQAVAQGMLDQLGCTVTVANNGSEAVDATEQQQFDIILMDCQMPEMDGFTATRWIRAQEHETGRRRTPIVALTANALDGDRQKCLDAGMDSYLSKPFRAEQLRNLIAEQAGSPPDRGNAAA